MLVAAPQSKMTLSGQSASPIAAMHSAPFPNLVNFEPSADWGRPVRRRLLRKLRYANMQQGQPHLDGKFLEWADSEYASGKRRLPGQK
jgi:hypothetical protein